MLLFVDETENDDLFLVGGLLVESREAAIYAYKKFKKRIRDFKIPDRYRVELYREFKSTLLDRDYPRVKARMLEEITQLNCKLVYACYSKPNTPFVQEMKESVYISLLSRIASFIGEDISIIFDAFNIPSFDQKIVDELSKLKSVQAIMGRNSQSEPGLQLADNLCSVYRHSKEANQKPLETEWYKMLENMIVEI